MPEPSPAVFVSYASQDAAAAQLICAALRTAGIEVWFDRRELRGGDVWDQLIRRQIRECALFVPLISAATEARLEGYFRLEWKLAVERTHSMADEKPFLVPVVIDHTPEADAHVPEPFRALQWTRLPGGDTTVSFVERIERLLSTAAPGPRPNTAVLKDSALRARPAAARPFASARLKLAVLLLVAAATLAIAYLGLLRSGATRTEPATGRFAETAGAAVAVAPAVIPEKSIAVLPFLDMSEKKDQEYFTDGLSEELLDLLAQVPDLRVAARTSSFYFKGKAQDVATIGQKLRVAHLLEGSIRKAGRTIRVTAQLIRADNGYHLWSKTYARDVKDVFKVQDEIAAAVVGALKLQLLATSRTEAYRPSNNEAYDHYLAGRQLGHGSATNSATRAMAEFRQAIALEPGYGPAYTGLADAMFSAGSMNSDVSVMELALATADQGVALAPRFAEAYQTRGWIRGALNLDVAGAQADLEQALRLDPSSSLVRESYAQVLATRGLLPQAIAEAERAVSTDPLAFGAWSNLGRYRYDVGEYPQAREALQTAISVSIEGEANRARYYLGSLELSDGHPESARAIFQADPEECIRLAGTALVEYQLSQRAASDRAVAQLVAKCPRGSQLVIATVHAFRGETDQAFAALDRGRAQHEDLRALTTDRLLQSLRSDARYKALLRGMMLAD